MKNKRIISLIAVILLLILTASFAISCNAQKKENYFVFGTLVSLNLSGNGAGKALENCGKLFNTLDADFDSENEGGSLYRINHAAADEIITVSADAYELLTLAKTTYENTDGVFNIATYGLSELWKFTSNTFNQFIDNYVPPTSAEVSTQLEHCNLDNLVLLGNNTVKKLDSGLKIGFGAIAKGFAGDRAKALLSDKISGVLDVGGTIFTVGDKTYNIGIGNPRESDVDYFAKMSVGGGACICTSGDYHRYYTVDNKRYHHILGKDGYPVDNGIISVTILSENNKISGAMCDVLSTAVFALGYEEGVKLVNDYGVSAVVIFNNKKYSLVNVGADAFTLKDTTYTENV